MIVNIIFGVIIIALIAMHYSYVKDSHELIEKLSKALMAKDLTDFTANQKIEENKEVEETKPEFIPLENVEDDKFLNTIKGEIEVKE